MKDLKLNAINRRRLAEKHMNSIKGGASETKPRSCGCGCAHADNGGSSVDANYNANYHGGASGLTSPHSIVFGDCPTVIVKP